MRDQTEIDLSGLSDMDADTLVPMEITARGVQTLSNMLSVLHVYDRPVDIDSLNQVLAEAIKYLRNLDRGGQREDSFEANFLRPLLRETIPAVFPRLFLIDPQHMNDQQTNNMMSACILLSNLCGDLLHYHWVSTNEFSPSLSSDIRRDMHGPLSILSFYLFNSQFHFMTHNAYRSMCLTTITAVYASAFPQGDPSLVGDTMQSPLVATHINHFGQARGFICVGEALKVPDRCGLAGVYMLLSVLNLSTPFLLPERRIEIAPGVAQVLKYIGQGFEAAADFSAFEDEEEMGNDGSAVYTTISGVLHTCCQVGGLIWSLSNVSNVAAPLQRQLVLRLLRSGHFTRQLAAVKELFLLLTRALRVDSTIREEAEAQLKNVQAGGEAVENLVDGEGGGASNQAAPPAPAAAGAGTAPAAGTSWGIKPVDIAIAGLGGLQALLDWIRAEKIVERMLRTNLHQPQYAEAAQRILVPLARHGVVTSEHLSFLWDLIEDTATFEDIKHNVCAILGAVTPHLPSEAQSAMLRRATAMAQGPSPAALSLALRLLESISRNDTDCVMPHEVLNTLCDIILRTESPLETATATHLADACLRYRPHSKPGTDHDWPHLVIQKCAAALKSGKGGVPAACQMFQAFAKVLPTYFPNDMDAAAYNGKIINSSGDLTCLAIDAYTAFLANQRAAAAKSPTHTLPPVGTIPHHLAVESYHKLIYELMMKSSLPPNCSQLDRILEWATVDADSPADSASSWQLLTALSALYQDLPNATEPAQFLANSLCKVSPAYVSWTAWRCVTAWMVLVCANNIKLDLGDGSGHGDFAAEVRVSQGMDWDPWRKWLTDVALLAPDPAAARSSQLLARLIVWDARFDFEATEYQTLLKNELERWQETLRGAVKTLCGRLPTAWHDSPPLAGGADLAAQGDNAGRISESRAAARAAQRALLHLQVMIDCGQSRSLPSRFAHSASYRDVECEIVLQITSTAPSKLSLWLPRNSYVGTLRTAAADLATRKLGLPFQAAQLRMLSGGKEHMDDGFQILKAGIFSPIMIAVLQLPNPAWALSAETRAELDASSPAEALAAAQGGAGTADVYSLALTMEEIELPRESDQDGTLGAALKTAARGVLGALPTSASAVADVERLLQQDNARKDLLTLLSRPFREEAPSDQQQEQSMMQEGPSSSKGPVPAPATGNGAMCTKDAVTRYAIETLCTQILPARNPLLTSDQSAEVNQRAGALLAHLFPSHVMPTLLHYLSTFPALGGKEGAPRLHSAMLLLSKALCEDMQNRYRLFKEEGDEKQLEGFYGACMMIFTFIADYVIIMMSSALGTTRIPSNAFAGTQSSPYASRGTSAASQSLYDVTAAELCSRGLDILRACVGLVPELATKCCKTLLSDAILALLGHRRQQLRDTTREWVEKFAAASPVARRWIFEVIITPLLLAPDPNEAQLQLANGFLGSLNHKEAEVAEGVLKQLVKRFLETADSGEPLRGMVESILTLVRRLDCHSIAEAIGIVNKLLGSCLLPELGILAHAPAGAPPSVAVVFQKHDPILQAARHSIACREACFDLLLELMTHDRASWDTGIEGLTRLIRAGAQALPRQYKNIPLPALRPSGALCGLKNGGATCYMNATFQQLFMQPTVRRLLLSSPAVASEEQEDSVFHQVQTIFAHLTVGVAPWFEPRGFWFAFKDYEGRAVNIREHQDAYEFFTRLQDSVDEHLRSRNHPRAIYAALGGTFAQVITVAGQPELQSQREEEFYQVSLDVRGKKGLLESLESYVAVELMNGENQWLCEEIGKKVDAEKRTLIHRLPHTLMLHLKRFEWDYETYSRWKVKDRFEFPLKLDMRPYTVEGAGMQSNGGDGDGTASCTTGLHPSEYYEYELRGIVIHSGTAFAGHYYSYIMDRESSGWYCFDDTSVEQWEPSNMEEDCFGGKYLPDGHNQECDRPNSAYMLVYERVKAVPESSTITNSTATAMEASPAGEAVAMAISPAVPAMGGNDRAQMEESTPPSVSAAAAVDAQPITGPGAAAGLNLCQQEAVARANLQAISTIHLMSSELNAFFCSLAQEMRAAATGGKARKAARVGLTSPGSNGIGMSGDGSGASGLARIASHRDNDLETVVAAAAEVCLAYYCDIVARGPQALVNELAARKGRGLFPALLACMRASWRVGYSTLNILEGDKAPGSGLQTALCAPYRDIREAARRFLLMSARSVQQAYGDVVVIDHLRPLFDRLMAVLSNQRRSMTQPMSSYSLWEDVLAAVEELTSRNDVFATLLWNHLDTVLSLGRPLVEGFWRMPIDDRYELDFGKNYLGLLSTVLLRYDHGYLSRGTAADAEYNPCCKKSSDGNPPLPLPEEAWDFLFSDDQFLRRLLMPGCVSNSGGYLLQWLWYNNYAKHSVIARAVMDHIDDDLCDEHSLAAELPSLVEALIMKDELTYERYKEALVGEADLAGVPDAYCFNLLDMCEENISHFRRAMLIRMIVLMHDADAEIWTDVVDMPTLGRGMEWAQHALGCVEKFRDRLRMNAADQERWNELAAECPDAQSYYQLDDLSEALAILAGEFEPGWESDFEQNEGAGEDGGQGGTGGEYSARGYGLLPTQVHNQGQIHPGTIIGAVGGVVLSKAQHQQEHQQGAAPAPGPVGGGASVLQAISSGGRQQADISAGGVHDDDELVAEIELGDTDLEEDDVEIDANGEKNKDKDKQEGADGGGGGEKDTTK